MNDVLADVDHKRDERRLLHRHSCKNKKHKRKRASKARSARARKGNLEQPENREASKQSEHSEICSHPVDEDAPVAAMARVLTTTRKNGTKNIGVKEFATNDHETITDIDASRQSCCVAPNQLQRNTT